MPLLSHEAFIQQYVLSYAQGGITGGHAVSLDGVINQADHAWEAIKVKAAEAKVERAAVVQPKIQPKTKRP